MNRRTAAGLAATSAVVLGMVIAGTAVAGAPERGRDPVALSVSPERLEITGLPCLPTGAVQVGMSNTTADDVYADAEIAVDAPLYADRTVFSSWLPAGDPDVVVTAGTTVRTPRDTAPGSYEMRVRSGRTEVSVPVEVLPLPPKGPEDDLGYGEQAAASSTHGSFDVCGAVDGDSDSEHWSTSTGWNDATRAVFPDSYDVALPEPATVGRVELYTLDSVRYPAAGNGLRDWDVQVLRDGSWTTVDEVRGNVDGHVTSTFEAVTAEAVRIVALDSNDHAYSRIVELEVYGG